MKHNSYKTATGRAQPSAPARYLNKMGLLEGNVLDFGCGRGKDADAYGLWKFDPHYCPKIVHPTKSSSRRPDQFDTIMCNYVLNTLPEEEQRQEVLRDIRFLLNEFGIGYVTVRADATVLNGWTSKGTWQGLIMLDLPLVHKTSGYRMYKLTKWRQDGEKTTD